MMKTSENPIALSDGDLYLFGKGDARKAYLTFGCHKVEGDTFRFVVWAPGARSVSLVGDFNGWNENATPMQEVRHGIYACVVSGLENGSTYKYRILGADGKVHLKADPYAFHAENGLSTASKVWDLEGYAWRDAKWLDRRAKTDPLHSPMSIYELHLGSWRIPEGCEFPNYREVGDQLVEYCKEMGYTHVELLPVTEYPFPASWGYQVTGYFSPTSRYGTPQDFMYMVDTLHAAGIGVILDWVPAHFPRDEFALARFDGTPLYEYADPRKGEHAEWGTLVFDFTKPEVLSFLISSACFFFDVYHIDGIRVDAVSSMLYLDYGRTDWVPNDEGGNINKEAVEFLKKMNEAVLSTFPGAITIAEESTAFPLVTCPPYDGGLGFTFKWDMGFMHDMLEYAALDPLWRNGSHDKLTFGMMYAFSENYVLAFSHDEVVHGKCSMLNKMSGEYEQKFANLRALMGYQFARPGKKLTFMGSEFGQVIEWDFKKQLDWFLLEYPIHDGMRAYSAALNKYYTKHEALWKVDDGWAGFGWANVDDRDENAIAFIRYANDGDSAVLACFNFSPVLLDGFRVGLPCAGQLRLVFNSDEPRFGGAGVKVKKTAKAQAKPFEGQPNSASVVLPPLSAIYYEFKKETRKKTSR
ncbi:MAG: 1,4-alpha-glucan branching protein GlgB [Eggerthellaceae bacterium]|nr:1,4-alpha-glucan branching protein GlgB [Eggerthellaceae bacterium]